MKCFQTVLNKCDGEQAIEVMRSYAQAKGKALPPGAYSTRALPPTN